MSEHEDDCMCAACAYDTDHELHVVDVALASGTFADEPSLMSACMRLSRGHISPEMVLAEIRRRDLFRSPHATWTARLVTWPTPARWLL